MVLAAVTCASPPPEKPIESSTDESDGIRVQPAGEKARRTPAKAAPTQAARKTKRPKTFVSAKTRRAALGSIVGFDPEARAAFSAIGFEPLGLPEPGTWLAEHRERGQTFDQFRVAKHHRPTEKRDTLYIQPLGKLAASGAPSGKVLAAFASSYFGVKTSVLPALDPNKLRLKWRAASRTRPQKQIHTGTALGSLKKRLPEDAFLMIAITGHDLYPDDDWNFVFGVATFRERVGIFSTARYNPAFYNANVAVPGFETIVLRRTINIMAHEVGHMYGLEHCVYYGCAMNGSNSLAETDRSPIHLCPVCLRKLRHGAGFGLKNRYTSLERFYRKHKLLDEANWVRDRLAGFPKD